MCIALVNVQKDQHVPFLKHVQVTLSNVSQQHFLL